MQLVLLSISFIKLFFTISCIVYSINKIENNSKWTDKFIFLNIIIISILYAVLKNRFNIICGGIICYFLGNILYIFYRKGDTLKHITSLFIATTMSMVSLFIASTIVFSIMEIFNINIREQNIIEYIIIGIIQNTLTYLFFRIKRFKYGFAFLRSKGNTKDSFVAMLISTIMIIISIGLGIYVTDFLTMVLIIFLVFGGIYLFYWIKKNITKSYKEYLKDKTVEKQEKELKEKDEEIKELKDELNKALEINHKYNHRLSAMEKAVGKLGNTLNFSEEYAKEYSNILDSLKEFSKEYKEEVENLSKTNKLPKTNIYSLDNLLDYMKSEAEKEKIKFELEVNTDVDKLIKSKIEKGKLETLLADHIRDAIIAINSKDKPNGIIKVVLDKTNDIYEISISDNGIEFDIETLIKLGLEPITTHKISGGSGIGFMTTFETLNKCKASLVIKEFDPMDDYKYSKEIVIRFDDKNEYRVESYRSAEIKEKDLRKRIIILDKYGKNI